MCFKACLECFSTPRFNHALRFGQIVLNGWATLIAEIKSVGIDFQKKNIVDLAR